MIDWGKVIINIIVTLIAYGAGPLIFCEIRSYARLRTVRTFCIVYTIIIWVLFQVSYFFLGEIGGNIWPAILWGGIFYKVIKNKMVPPEAAPKVHVDVDLHKGSATLGRDPLTPYYTKKRYQNKDWATIETFLNSTLCGEKGEELLFKYRSTITSARSSTIVELIYIFDSFTKNGEKYSELYVCDEYDDETTVPPVGYRYAKELTVHEDCEAKTPAFSLSFPDEKPTAHGSYNIRGSDVLLEQSDKTSSYCLSTPTETPFVPYGDSDIFGHELLKKEPLETSGEEEKHEPQPSVEVPPVEQVQEIRFCRKCGSRLMEGSRFCSQCGTAVIIVTSGKAKPPLSHSVQSDVTNHINKESVEESSLRKDIENALKYTTDDGCYRYMKLKYTSLPATEKLKIEPLLCLPANQFRLELEKILSSLD